MRQIKAAFLVLVLGILACARSNNSSPSNDVVHTLTLGGRQRTYILHLPVPLNAGQALPLVFDFHGGGGNSQTQLRTSGFNALADEKTFIVVYPDGSGLLGDKLLTWNGGTCCGYAVKQNIDDVAFVRAVLADVASTYKVDLKRVYATGLSNGGIFSYRLACDAADIFAAIGPVSGTLNLSPCAPKNPYRSLIFTAPPMSTCLITAAWVTSRWRVYPLPP